MPRSHPAPSDPMHGKTDPGFTNHDDPADEPTAEPESPAAEPAAERPPKSAKVDEWREYAEGLADHDGETEAWLRTAKKAELIAFVDEHTATG